MKTTKKINRGSALYAKAMKVFGAQFGDVAEIVRLFVNNENQVYAAEWNDSKGMTNFNSGYAPDVKTIINII